MSFSKITLSKFSLERSHEQVYIEGAKSLLTLVNLVLTEEENNHIVKLFLCDYHLRNSFNFKELVLLPHLLLVHCLNAISLKHSFGATLEHFMPGGEDLIREWQMSI